MKQLLVIAEERLEVGGGDRIRFVLSQFTLSGGSDLIKGKMKRQPLYPPAPINNRLCLGVFTQLKDAKHLF